VPNVFVALRKLQNLDPRFKSGRRLQFHNPGICTARLPPTVFDNVPKF